MTWKEDKNGAVHNELGHFVGSGNPKGRQRREREAEIQAVISEHATPERVKQVLDALHLAATKFQKDAAARIYLEYAAGKPAQQVDMNVNDTSAKGYIGISPDDWDDLASEADADDAGQR